MKFLNCFYNCQKFLYKVTIIGVIMMMFGVNK